MSEFAPVRVLSSPLIRCLQSVEPFAAREGSAVELSKGLRPDSRRAATTLLHEIGAGTGPVVLCTHGEVIEHIQSDLREKAPSNLSHAGMREKGSVWVLQYQQGRIARADYLAPPS